MSERHSFSKTMLSVSKAVTGYMVYMIASMLAAFAAIVLSSKKPDITIWHGPIL